MVGEDTSIGSAFSSPSSDICGFRYRPTCGYVKYLYRNGKWDEGEFVSGSAITVSVMSNVLHYGQALFEGLKVFSTKPPNGRTSGDAYAFCDGLNFERMKDGAKRLAMEMVSKETWTEAIDWCVTGNRQFLPSYYGNRKGAAGQEGKEGCGGCGVIDGCSLYVRPMLFGSGELLTPVPSNEFTFLVICMPVSTQYYAKPAEPGASSTSSGNSNNGSGGAGLGEPKLNSVDCLVLDEYDRAAPRGVGFVKAAGNYAADIYPSTLAKADGYPICLYLDAKHKEFVEEFNTSNFVAIVKKTPNSNEDRNNQYVYVTPSSEGWGGTVLASVTNRCLQKLAQEEFGMEVEKRNISFEKEVGSFIEVGAVGTAVVITKIKSFAKGDNKWNLRVSEDGILDQMCSLYTKIQRGEKEDKHGWLRKVDMQK
eukprot:GHVS01063056.1.p1 GENE.GHVS01063056.1~~GHVS01063056.1.p1  ORF type:complete len:422 (+),score=70.28 GHVS01063056.1:92-1357(+)